MGKRTCEKSDEEIKKKIRRLERELHYRQKPPPNNGGYEDHRSDTYDKYRDELELDGFSGADNEPPLTPPFRREPQYAPSVSREPPSVLPRSREHSPEQPRSRGHSLVLECMQDGTTPPETQAQVELDRQIDLVNVETPPSATEDDAIPIEILEVLGVAKRSEESCGKKIPYEIAERLGKILLEGLAKEQKESLVAKMLIPENFQLAKAPKLNAEVASILVDTAKNRDKRLEGMQNQLGRGIAGLTDLTADLISNDLTKMEIIKRVSEANQIFLDLHYEKTMNRRRLIIPMLDRSFIKIIEGVKRDQLLFGDNLGDNIKSTKSLERTGLQIKKPLPAQASSSKRGTGYHQGNGRAPPRQVPGTGIARAPLAQARPYHALQQSARRPPPPVQQRRAPPQQAFNRFQSNRQNRR